MSAGIYLASAAPALLFISIRSVYHFHLIFRTMKTTTSVFVASPSRKSDSHINLQPRSPPTKKISHDLDSPASASKRLDRHRKCDSDSSNFHAPNSPTRALKRLVKSASKNAQKFAITLSFSPRRHLASLSLSFDSPPPKSYSAEGKAREGIVRELCSVFLHFDADGDGKLSWVDLKTALNSVGEEVGENELRYTIKQLETEADGCIDIDGFIRLKTEKRGAEEAEKDLAAAFRMFEGRPGGGISPWGLQRMMCRLGLGVGDDGLMSLEHCNFIVSRVDLDGDGVVNFHEFKRMMTVAVH